MDSNLTNVGYVEEVVPGTTPSAALQLLRRTGGNLTPQTQTTRSSEIRSSLRPGNVVRTSQMVRGSLDVEWSYGTLDDMLEGMLMDSWASNVLVDGTTKKSYTFEEQFVDGAISPSQYMIYKLCRIGSISMDLALNSIVTGSVGIMGATPSNAQASAGTGNTAATTTEAFNCTDMLSQLQENSSDLGKVYGLSVNIDRALRPKEELTSLNPFEIGVGRLMVTGQIQQYFEDARLIAKYLAFTQTDLDFTLTDSAGNDLQCEIPKIRFVGDADISNPGPDGDRLVTLNWEAEALDSDAALIRFTRTPA